MRYLLAFATVVLLSASGCYSQIEQYCSGCTTVDYQRTEVPPPALGTSTQVVLVHGAFGFGHEWEPVVSALRQSPGLSFFAWTWPGPFRSMSGSAKALASELQALVDQLPVSVEEVVVLAHSGAGLLTNYAARQLRVPAGRRVTVALLDPALRPTLAKQKDYLPVPARVTMTIYVPSEPPQPQTKPPVQNLSLATDLPREYVGKVGHNPLVAKVALPMLTARKL